MRLESSSGGLRDQPPARSNYTKERPLTPTQTQMGPKRRLDELHRIPDLSQKVSIAAHHCMMSNAVKRSLHAMKTMQRVP